MITKSSIKRFFYKRPSLFHYSLVGRSLIGVPFRRFHIRRYLKQDGPRLLQLGSGRNHFAGWINTDLYAKPPQFVYVDLTRKMPFPDNSFDRIFSEHAIEHIDWKSGKLMLEECFRILKPGGRLHLETPDLAYYARLFQEAPDETQHEVIANCCREYDCPTDSPSACFTLNHMARHYGHQFIYDDIYLRASLELAGFTNIKRMPDRSSPDPHFDHASGRKPSIDMRCNLVIEAEKPVA